jgi:hypothetical protein
MAILETTKERIHRAIENLPPENLTEVERFLEFLVFKGKRKRIEARPSGVADERTAVEALLAEMRSQGLLAEPTPEMRAHVQSWQALSEEERQAIVRELRALRLDPPLSEVITCLRAGEFVG